MQHRPHPNRSCLIASLVILLTIAVCTACSSAPTELNPDPELKEIPANKTSDIDSPEGALFQSAKKSYQNRLFSVAKDQFSALVSNFPTGPYVEFAELKIADSNFFIRDFDIAAPLYEEYAKNHPGSLSSAYALLMAARSFHLSSKGVGHDAHALERAREIYSRLLEQYPDSVYSKQAAAYQQSAVADLTANEHAVAAFYKKQGLDDAYHARLKIIREKWHPLSKDIQQTFEKNSDAPASPELTPDSIAPETVVSEVTIAPAEEIADEIETSETVPREKTEVPEETVSAAEITAQEEGATALPASKHFSSAVIVRPVPTPEGPEPVKLLAPKARISITKVECSQSSASFFLSQPWEDRGFLQRSGLLEPVDGVISISLPLTSAEERTYNCFGTGGLLVMANGTIVIENAKPMFVKAMNNPPRLTLISKNFPLN